jgi:molecular chaperone HtpG
MIRGPVLYMHHTEGTLDYSTLFYIPGKAPIDLFRETTRLALSFYLKRLLLQMMRRNICYILRFVRGIIDSEDLLT